MTAFTIDFFRQYRHLGGTQMESGTENAVAFAFQGLERHSAEWARVLDQSTGVEKRLCARAIALGHHLSDPRICRENPLCNPCAVLTTRWSIDSDEDYGWRSIS